MYFHITRDIRLKCSNISKESNGSGFWHVNICSLHDIECARNILIVLVHVWMFMVCHPWKYQGPYTAQRAHGHMSIDLFIIDQQPECYRKMVWKWNSSVDETAGKWFVLLLGHTHNSNCHTNFNNQNVVSIL